MPEKAWTLSVACMNPKTKEMNVVRYKFISDAVTVAEAFEAVHAAGFICVTKSEGVVRPAGKLLVRISSGEL